MCSSPSNLVSIALAHHQRREFEPAERIYREILSQSPDHPDALHFLGLLLFQIGDAATAIELMGRSIQLSPDAPQFHNNFANVLRSVGRVDAACEHARRATRLDPSYAEAYNGLGLGLAALAQHEQAIEAFDKALAVRPAMIEAHCNLARSLAAMSRLDDAIKRVSTAIASYPQVPLLHAELAALYSEQGRPNLGIAEAKRALAIDPKLPSGHNALGYALTQTGQSEAAIPHFRQAVALEANYAIAWSNLGAALMMARQPELAKEACEKAICLRPSLSDAHMNLGSLLLQENRIVEAKESMERAARLNPKAPEVWIRLGMIHQRNNALENAIAAYEEAIRLRPSAGTAYWNKSLALLLSGDFARGWAEYEWRWHCPELIPDRRHFAEPRWDGTRKPGQTILLWSEQGFGDTIQFARYAPLVQELCGKVILECQPQLKRVLQTVPGIAEIFGRGESLPKFHCQVPLMSLPFLFGTTPNSIPARIPYLHPLPSLVRRWRERLAGHPGRLKIGLVWAGSPRHRMSASRNTNLRGLAPLAWVPGVTYFSLQKGEAAGTTDASDQMNIIDLADELDDFVDTAAVIAALDLVITVDTAVAHLAGALGTPAWILLTFSPDWRWMLERADSPWYPRMRLIRQHTPGDWGGPAARAAADLAELSAALAAREEVGHEQRPVAGGSI